MQASMSNSNATSNIVTKHHLWMQASLSNSNATSKRLSSSATRTVQAIRHHSLHPVWPCANASSIVANGVALIEAFSYKSSGKGRSGAERPTVSHISIQEKFWCSCIDKTGLVFRKSLIQTTGTTKAERRNILNSPSFYRTAGSSESITPGHQLRNNSSLL